MHLIDDHGGAPWRHTPGPIHHLLAVVVGGDLYLPSARPAGASVRRLNDGGIGWADHRANRLGGDDEVIIPTGLSDGRPLVPIDLINWIKVRNGFVFIVFPLAPTAHKVISVSLVLLPVPTCETSTSEADSPSKTDRVRDLV